MSKYKIKYAIWESNGVEKKIKEKIFKIAGNPNYEARDTIRMSLSDPDCYKKIEVLNIEDVLKNYLEV